MVSSFIFNLEVKCAPLENCLQVREKLNVKKSLKQDEPISPLPLHPDFCLIILIVTLFSL